MTSLGIKIKKKLLDRHMTQAELAKRVGTSKYYLTEIIYGRYSFKRSLVLKKILRELEMEHEDD